MSEQEKLTSTTEKDQNLLLPMNMQKLIREPQTYSSIMFIVMD